MSRISEEKYHRLVQIKLLYNLGFNLYTKNDISSCFSILHFHDSIEMFLKFVAENKGINSAKFGFLDYWTHISNLTHKESMRSFNQRRVNLKHKGLEPSSHDVTRSQVVVYDFFKEQFNIQFETNFDSISLTSRIKFQQTRKYIKLAESKITEGDFKGSIINSGVAFHYLLAEFERNKSTWYGSPFRFSNTDFISINDIYGTDREFRDALENVVGAIEDIDGALKISALGIDYREYVKFNILTPFIHREGSGKLRTAYYREKKWTEINSQFCVDFVIKYALKLQELDFDISTLETPGKSLFDDIQYIEDNP